MLEGWARKLAILRPAEGAQVATGNEQRCLVWSGCAPLAALTIIAKQDRPIRRLKATRRMGGAAMNRPRAADDFATHPGSNGVKAAKLGATTPNSAALFVTRCHLGAFGRRNIASFRAQPSSTREP